MQDRSSVVKAVIGDIQNGKISAGEYLSQRGVAESYNCGRTVAYGALQDLCASIWLEVTGNGKFVVKDISANTMQQAIELRAVLEIFAAERLVILANSHFMQTLKSINDRMLAEGKTGEFDVAVLSNREFHTRMISAADEGPLSRLFEQLYAIRGFDDVGNFETIEQVYKSHFEHDKILEGVESGKLKHLSETINLHVFENAEGWFRGA